MELKIRPAVLEDVQCLNRVKTMDQVFQTTCNDMGESLHQTLSWMENLTRDDYLFVAETSDKSEAEVIGYVMLEVNSNPRFRHTANLRIAVSTDYQKHGVGSKLLAFALEYADKWLCLFRVELTVMCHQKATISLYKKYGFIEEGIKRRGVIYDGDYVDVMCMGRLKE